MTQKDVRPVLCYPRPASPVHPDLQPSPPGKHSEGGSHYLLSDWGHLRVRIRVLKIKSYYTKQPMKLKGTVDHDIQMTCPQTQTDTTGKTIPAMLSQLAKRHMGD